MKKTLKLKELIRKPQELSCLECDNLDMEVHVNIGEYDDTIAVNHVSIASNDKYDYISIDTELSK